jgi:RNA polymerase primary sigma factor
MDKFINDVDEENDDGIAYPAIARLIELGRQKSYITIDDILHFFPEAEQDVEQLEEAFAALMSAGIPYIEDETPLDGPVEDDLDEETEEKEEEEDTVLSFDDLENIDTDDTIGLYLKEVSRVPLLNAEEEVELAQRIERGRIAREELAKGNASNNRRYELRKLIEDGWNGREHLITANSRLVISVAKKYMGRGVPFLDLIQEGNIGLIRATKKFDYRRGHKFSTYATWWIRQAVTRAIQVARRPLSLETPTDDEEDSVLGDFIEDDEAPPPDDMATYNLLKEHLEEVLNGLPPREVRILQLRYGLLDGQAYTLEEVGRKMGVTRERVRQIEAQALSRLRHPVIRRKLRDYLGD